MERTILDRDDGKQARLVDASPRDFQPGVCGSCYWRRQRLQFGNLTQICSVMPKQVMAVARGSGAQVLSLNPVIENLAEEMCAMWKPLPEDTQ